MTSDVSSVANFRIKDEFQHVEGQVHHISQSTVMTNRDSKDDNSCSNAQNSKSILVASTTVYVKTDAGQRVYQNSEFS